MIAFGGMVVDNVENELDAGVVQSRNGRSKCIEGTIDSVAGIGSEEGHRVVAPVVAQAALDQMPIIDKRVDRQQFNCGDPETLEMIDHCGGGQAAIRSAPCRRHVLAQLREAFDVRFINNRVAPGNGGPAFFAPGEGFVHNHTLRHTARIVAPVEREIGACAAGAVAEMRIAPDESSRELLCIRINKQFVRVEAQSTLGVIGAMHPIAIELPRGHIAQVAVPDILCAFRQRYALDLAPTMAIEEAQFDFFGVRRKQREICSAPVPSCSQRMRRAGRNPHATAPEREKLQRGAEQQG